MIKMKKKEKKKPNTHFPRFIVLHRLLLSLFELCDCFNAADRRVGSGLLKPAFKDCSWFHDCSLDALSSAAPGFKSAPADARSLEHLQKLSA